MNTRRDWLGQDSDDVLDRMIRAARQVASPEESRKLSLERAAAIGNQEPSVSQEPRAPGLSGEAGPIGPAVFSSNGRSLGTPGDVSQNHVLARVKKMILSHKRLTAATAALTTLAAGLILYASLFSSPMPAYALEDTVQANQHMTSYHAKLSPSWGGMSEVWVQLNPDGSPLRARIDYPQTEDGAKVVFCSEGKAAVWFKDKNGYTVLPEKSALSRVAEMRKLCDPKLAFEELQTREKSGKVKIETTAPANKGEFIKLTVTSPGAPGQKEVYEVNPATKLAERVTYYSRQGEKWNQTKLIEYLDYNKPIDPKVFEPDLPKDVMKSDQIKRPPGVEKGNLSNEQIAAKVVREFFEALIAKDFEKAGLIYSGIPAERIKAGFERLNVARIVEVGTPLKGMHPDPTALAVPIKVEFGTKAWSQEFSPQVPYTDDESAAKAARGFFEALIRQDEMAARKALEAGLVFEGFDVRNAGKIRDFFSHVRVVRILEVGKPAGSPQTKLLEVPVKAEVELGGTRVKEFRPYVRPVYNRADRWAIIGGL